MAKKGEGTIDDPHIHYYDYGVSKSVIDKCRDGDTEYRDGMKIQYGFMGNGVIRVIVIEKCENCKFWVKEDQQCTNDDYVRESLVDVSGMGEMMVDIMIEDNILDTFGTPPDYHCMYWEEKL